MTNEAVDTSVKEEMKLLMKQAELCQSLTHPFRLKILQMLGEGRKNVSEIMMETNKPQPFISQHLRVLREKKVVTTERDRNEIYYSLSDPKIVKICELVVELIDKR